MKNIQYINAGAGSGKTTKLTQILSEELSKANGEIKPSEVILTTFTELAASEFREKSRQQLFKDGHPDVAAELDSATIGTVHSVALSFIQRYWYLIGVSPDMKVMSEDDLQVYISESLGDYVSLDDLKFFNDYRAYYDIKDSQGKADFDFWKESLLAIIDKANNYSVDIERSKKDSCAIVDQIFDNKTPLDHTLLTQFIGILDSEIKSYADNPKKKAQPLLDSLRTRLTYSVIAKLYNTLTDDRTLGKKNTARLAEQMGQRNYNDLVKNLEKVLTSSKGEDSPGGMMKKMISILFDIASQWKDGFNEFKTRRHIIDYNDMERLFLKLLDMPKVSEEIQGTYKLMMVDEFQDSSPIQLKIFKRLSDMMKQSYWVGDPKQSIYGFRGADVALVNEITKQFLDPNIDPNLKLTHSKLPKSWRTRQPLVKLTNDCFTRAFKDIISQENVILLAARQENGQLSDPLSHWNCYASNAGTFVEKVADRIKLLKDSGIKIQVKNREEYRSIRYGDIAVLCRTNSECKSFANALVKIGVPVSYVNSDILQQIEVQLVFTLLKFMVDASNKHVRADLLRLLDDIPTQDILQQRLDYLVDRKSQEGEESTQDCWLDEDNRMIQKLKTFKQTVRNLSVSDLLESIVYGLALPEVVAKWGDGNNRRQNLQTLCALAKQYDEHCLQMGIGASVGGLLTYLSYAEIDSKIDNASDAVKVLTYHKSKGLEWYYVILSSLEDNSLEENAFTRKCFWGVHELRHPKPSEQYSYVVQFLPRIVSTSNTNIPLPIINKCKALPTYRTLEDKERNELRHLLYVGMTRARDYLTTLSHQTNQAVLPTLFWIMNTGISQGNLNGGADNLWNYNSLIPAYEDITNCPVATAANVSSYNHYKYPDQFQLDDAPKILSPSKLPMLENYAPDNIKILADLECRIDPYKTDVTNQAAAGTCIHNIFAVYDPCMSHEENVAMAEHIRNMHNMWEAIPNVEKVITSIEKLYEYLEKTYGAASAIKHETPFVQPISGQIVNGEIDLLWYINDQECVLIDFKNFPGSKATITNPDPNNDHYAGIYAAQLEAYHDVLIRSGLTVKATLIYYSVMGCVVELKM